MLCFADVASRPSSSLDLCSAVFPRCFGAKTPLWPASLSDRIASSVRFLPMEQGSYSAESAVGPWIFMAGMDVLFYL